MVRRRRLGEVLGLWRPGGDLRPGLGLAAKAGGVAGDGVKLRDIDAAFTIPIDVVERANHRKLTAEDVRAIRASKRSINALARRFHVEPKAVRLARRGDTHADC